MNTKKIMLLFLPCMSFPWVSRAEVIWPSVSSQYTHYWENSETIKNSGIASLSGNWMEQNAAGSQGDSLPALQTTSRQGLLFTMFRDLLRPFPVTDFSAHAQGDGSVQLHWSASSDQESGVLGYRIYRTYFNGPLRFTTRVAEATENSGTDYLDTSDLPGSIQFQYEVRAVDYAWNEQSQGNSLQWVAIPPQPHSIVDLQAQSKPGGDIELHWSAVAGAAYYRIYRSTLFGVRGVQINPDNQTALPNYLDVKSGLTSGVQYFYQVHAVVAGVEEQRGNNQSSAFSDQGGPNPPLIRSLSHPVPEVSYPDPNPVFQWLPSSDPGSSLPVAGYYIKLDAGSATGTAVSGPGWIWVTGLEKQYFSIANGVWYFHCLALDQAGNLGAEAVFSASILATGSLAGKVDENGWGVSGITVEAWQNDRRIDSVATDGSGQYILPRLPLGAYRVIFNRFGYQPRREEIALDLDHPDQIKNITFSGQAVMATNESAAYPNPASGGEVRFLYFCDQPSRIQIEIFNVAGRPVGKIEETKPAGYQFSAWPLQSVAQGVYIFKATIQGTNGANKQLAPKKFSVVK